ncbi:MAG: ATP-binding protein, partial [Deltaproteobacteria bacterium]|nr:ATP-binding protein [Deltaproteobacteria bacterium]
LFTDRYLDSKGRETDAFASRREVEAFLGMEPPGPDAAAQVAAVDDAIRAFRANMAARLEASAEAGLRFPVEDLRAAFNLDDTAVDCLVALAAPDLDHGFARAYSHAMCDFTRRHVDVAFLTDLLAGGEPDRGRVWSCFAPSAPLARRGLVEMGWLADQGPATRFTDRPLKAADRVVAWMRGVRDIDETVLGRAAGVPPPGRPLDRLLMPPAVKTAFVEAFRDVGSRGGPRGLCLVGAQGCGRKALVQAALAAQGRPLVVLDVTGLPPDEERRRAYLAALVREVVMVGGVLYLEGVEPNPPAGAKEALADVVAALSNYHGPVVAGSLVRAREALRGIGDFVEVEVPFPDAEDQERLWRAGFPEECRLPPGFDVREIVGRYTLSGGAIRAVCREAARWADTAGRRAKSVPASVVVDAIRGQLTHRLSSLAIPVHKGEGWEDLVLPTRTVDLLKEIVSFFRNRRQILEQWGLGAKLLRSPGLPCLFSGQPGTGKTMAASIIARDLGREIFQVDLSRIVDKYIGETEKNLARVFEEGARAQAILLFDEADSLFAKRTDVKSSIDRYANLEVNYLLQRVESYDGIAILTTNFASSIDDAFKRRLRFSVEFPFPEQAERVRLWHALLPREVPLAGQIDFDELAERFVVSGGHIRNIIIRAVTLAADRKKSVDMAMFQQAGNAEYRLMGKLVREDTGD